MLNYYYFPKIFVFDCSSLICPAKSAFHFKKIIEIFTRIIITTNRPNVCHVLLIIVIIIFRNEVKDPCFRSAFKRSKWTYIYVRNNDDNSYLVFFFSVFSFCFIIFIIVDSNNPILVRLNQNNCLSRWQRV